jgi:FkbM family methyltransferase
MKEQIGRGELSDQLPRIMSALLDSDLEHVSQQISRAWPQCQDDPRLVVLAALLLLSAKNTDALCTLLSSLDHGFFEHNVLSGLRDLVLRTNGLGKGSSSLLQVTEFLDRVRDPGLSDEELGFRRSQCPILTELNGDPFWIFADVLPYLWHVVQLPIQSLTPQIQAETEHYTWVRERLAPGDVVYDVGANVGLFTNMMSRRVGALGKVRAFEPNPPVFEDLKRIVVLNQLTNVDLYPVAVSDSEGFAAFNQILSGDVTREASGLALGGYNQTILPSAISVATTTLDLVEAATPHPPSLIKIDVEGAEFHVLRGARRALAKYHPKLVIEFHVDSAGYFDHVTMEDLLKTYDYKFQVFGKSYFCE